MMRLPQCLLPILCVGLVCAIGLPACSGFHLRGADSVMVAPLQGRPVLVTGVDTGSGFGAALVQALQQAGAGIADSQEAAGIRLEIVRVNDSRTVSAYSASRQVREFNHALEVTFSARRNTPPGSSPDTAPVTASVRAERNQIYDGRHVLGVAEEERSIRQELQAEVARLLVVRLGVLHR